MSAEKLRQEILALVERYAAEAHAPNAFTPGESSVPVSGKVYGAPEMRSLADACLDFWLTTGRFNVGFERALASTLKVKHALTTNSGSSSNLLAVAALTCPSLGERALKPGDEVITVAAGFPTTVNPLLLYGLVPVFIDIELGTYNARPELLAQAICPRTRAVMLAHTLGNPFDLNTVLALCRKHDLWLIEDSCDALGSTYECESSLSKPYWTPGPRMAGTFGDIGTVSFYPAHHITTGEGGAVYTDDAELKRLLESVRDWGRDCFCDTGKDNTCGKRFGWKLGDLPEGYDHKYIYSNLGYNLKMTDLQAAVGLAQLKRLPDFVEARRRNFDRLKARLAPLEDMLVLPRPSLNSRPSWFGFPITLRPDCPFARLEVVRKLDASRVGTRVLFAGNLTRQPYFKDKPRRLASGLENTDAVTERGFWVGVYPGLDDQKIDYIADSIFAALGRKP